MITPFHREFAALPHQQASPPLDALRASAAELVNACPLPALLVGLPFGEILVANNGARSVLIPSDTREPGAAFVGRRLGDVLGDPSSLEVMLALLSAGQLESFCRRQPCPGGNVAQASVHVAVTAHPAQADDPAHHAIAVVQQSSDHVDDGAAAGATRDAGKLIGIVNREWRLTHLSSSVRAFLGDEWLDDDPAVTAHVHPGDIAKLLMAVATLATGMHQSSLTARLRAAGGRWVTHHLVVATLDTETPPAFAFVASPVQALSTHDPSCDCRLSESVRQIANLASLADVCDREEHTGAAGLQLSRLTKREREVVSMLLAGEDVAGIATGLFISPSTVRNHLAASFRKLGVRSQRELLRRVRECNVPYP